MDSLTQIVLGGAVGEAALGKKVGNKAILWGAVAGTIPDLDVIGRFFLDDITALEWHRGFSHSLVFSLMAAPILGYMVQHFSRDKAGGYLGWIWLFFLSLVTHPLLDCHTTWGTQFLWPLDLRIAYNNIFVVDPLYTLPFLVLLVVVMTKHRESPARRKLNRLGLIISSSYMLITLMIKAYTHQVFTDNIHQQGVEYSRMSTRPTPLNAVLWTANVETRDSFMIGYYSLFDENQLVDFNRYPKHHHLIDSIREEDQLKRLIHITQNWFLIQKKADGLYLCDLRFGEMGMNDSTGKFVFNHKLLETSNGIVIEQIDPDGGDAGPMLQKLWKRIKGRRHH